MTRRKSNVYSVIWKTAVIVAAAAVGALYAKRKLAAFGAYDDEGYMLLSFAHYLRDGHLYTATYSQYGPFYFYAQEFWFKLLRLPVTLDSGRLVTLLYWLLSGVLAGQFVHKLTRNTLLAAFGILACMVQGTILSNEPGHPQQVIFLLFMVSSVVAIGRGWAINNLHFCILGIIGAALLFTKVNVGVFFVAALAHSLICLLSPGPVRTLGLSLSLVYAVVGPLLLMHADLFNWAAGYCFVAIVCGSAVFACGSWVRGDPALRYKSVLWAAGGVVLGSALIVAVTLVRGVTLAALLRGVVLDPLKHPRVFSIPMLIGKAQSLWSVLATGCAVTICLLRRRKRFQEWISFVQCFVGIVVMFLLFQRAQLADFVPFLPLGLLSIIHEPGAVDALFPRLFITDLAVTQFLQPYPVAGSQVYIAGLPIVLWSIICILDGYKGLTSILERVVGPIISAVPQRAVLAAVMILAFSRSWIPLYHSRFWSPDAYPASTLFGSSFLHLPTNQEERYRFLSDNIKSNCSVLFTVPGMGSFNFWSGVPTPNGWNLTSWTNAFDDGRQKEIVALLQSNPRACVIYDPELVEFRRSSIQELEQSPLGRYVLDDMVKVEAKDGYEIRINPGRGGPWIATAE